jgi:nucleoside-diphosphate-sugar epimerase
MNKTYLITGGTGFIGSAIAKRLVKEKNTKVICLDSNLRGNLRKIRDIRDKITFIKNDIRNLKQLVKISKNVDSIIHLAFLNGTENFYKKPDLVLDIGVKGIINVIEACKKNKKIIKLKIKGSGGETRAFNYIDDFIEGFMIILKKGKHLNLYNIGSSKEISIKNLVKKIAKLLNIKINIETSSLPKGGTLRRCPNINKIKKLGYKPKIKIEDGLKEMISWYGKNLDLKKNV